MGVWPSNALLNKPGPTQADWEPPDGGWESAESTSWTVGL